MRQGKSPSLPGIPQEPFNRCMNVAGSSPERPDVLCCVEEAHLLKLGKLCCIEFLWWYCNQKKMAI